MEGDEQLCGTCEGVTDEVVGLQSPFSQWRAAAAIRTGPDRTCTCTWKCKWYGKYGKESEREDGGELAIRSRPSRQPDSQSALSSPPTGY